MTGRNARFVAAARRLLLMQAGACLLALAVAAWAWFEVRGLLRERDTLAAQVAELEKRAQALPLQAPPPAIAPMPAPTRRPAPRRKAPEPAGNIAETATPTEPTKGGEPPIDPKPPEPAGDPPRDANRVEAAPLTRR